MATDSTNLPLGETNADAGSDMTGSELDLTSVQLAQVEGAQPVELPKGNQVVLIPVQPGQVIQLPTDSVSGLLAKIGPEGNLAIVVDGRTIILQGYLKANDQTPVKIVTNDGDTVDVADVIAATDPSLDIQTAAGPATGGQGDGADGSGIFIPFETGPGLGGIGAEGVLGATALQYRLIDDDFKEFPLGEEDGGPGDIDITFDILGGIVNEDDLGWDKDPELQAAKIIVDKSGFQEVGNDPFDKADREEGGFDSDGEDGYPDADPEPLHTVATVKVDFGPDVPGTLSIDASELPTDLTSEGGKIIYAELPAGGGQGNGIVGFVDNNKDGKFDAGDRLVFDIKVQEDSSPSEFHIVFTLHDNIDNKAPDQNVKGGDGSPDLLGGDEQLLGLPVKLTVEDSDGSTKSAVMQFQVEDDIPFFGQVHTDDGIYITNIDPGIAHDETPGVDGDANDVDPIELIHLIPELPLKLFAAGYDLDSLPFESEGSLPPFQTAQTQVHVSFGADGPAVFNKETDAPNTRDSIYGALSGDGENEHPFELFMIDPTKGATPTEDDKSLVGDQGNLTVEDQKTNATVNWFGKTESVYLDQIDAHTIVGYILVDEQSDEGEEALQIAAEGEGEGEGRELVFILHIDDEGVLSFVQFHQINHDQDGVGGGDPDLHDDPFQIQGPDGTPIIYVRATDFDGDHVTKPVNLQIQDDGPTATCDFDHVTEGAGNYATGNVVTGASPENALLGTDANGTDGNADTPGVDAPYTISKLVHNDHTYELIDNGDGTFSAKKDGGAPGDLGPDDSFDGSKLTIKTEEGATFEIILVSNTQAEVGEYKYTAGPNPTHAEDVLVGPADIAATRSDAFNTVGEWQSAFTTGGINLVANGGGLAIKNVDVNPKAGFGGAEDYRGIGVNTGLDGAEVDTQNENLTLEFDAVKFPGGVNNAELLIGALFNGVQFDSGSQEILKWEAYDGATLIASGLIVGDYDGLVTLDIDTADNFNKIVLTPLNNGAGNNGNNSDFLLINVEVCEQEPVKEEFEYTLRDGDGDVSSATLKICVEDTQPTVPQDGSGTLCLTVDEDGLPAGIGNSNSPNDAPATDNSASGFIVFTPGADPVSIELSVGNGGDTGLKTLAGQTVLAAWDAASSTLIGYIAGTDPSDSSNQVFKMTVVDPTTGEVTFDLLKPIKHADGGQDDNTENYPDPYFTVNVEIEDKDCDVAFTTVKVKIDDDMPVITQQSGNFSLIVDESLDGNTTPNNAGDHPHDPGDRIEDDEDGAGLPTALTNIASLPGVGDVIGAAKTSGSSLFTFQPGADGLQSAVYTFTLLGGGNGPVATNLIDTLSGLAISLQGGFADGTVRGLTSAGDIVFAFSINGGTGEVSMAQYRAINHGAEEAAPGNHDEEKALGAPASSTVPPLVNLLSVTLTVTDKDNDTVSSSADITGKVKFEDDGPKLDIKIEHDVKIRVDESVGKDKSDSNAHDEEQTVDPTDIGYAKIFGNDLFDDDSSFGQDGPGTKAFKLLIPGGGPLDSGLDDTATNSNVLLTSNPAGTLIEGRSATGGHLVFTIAIDPATGDVTVTQFRAIEHGDDDDHDDYEVLGGNKVQVEYTITDKDGDSATTKLDLGAIIKFEDDGPKADLDKIYDAQIVLDESKGVATGPYADGNAPDEEGQAPADDIAYKQVAGNTLFTDNSEYGSDGPGTKVYSLVLDNNPIDSGLDDVATGANIRLHRVSDTVVEGRPDVPGTDPVAFRITIDPATGQITISQFRAVEHDNAGDSASTHDESGSPEIMDEDILFIRQTIFDKDGDHDSDEIDLGKLIRFEDDGPVAVNDVDSVEEDGAVVAFGNVYNGVEGTFDGTNTDKDANITDGNADDIGSDGFQQLQWKDPSSGTGFDGNGNVVGLYGTLFVQSDGDYKYVLNNGLKAVQDLNDGDKLYDTFKYVITDKDGDTSTAELKITINGKDDVSPPTAEGAFARVDEDGLPAGLYDEPLPDAPGDDDADQTPDTVVGEATFRDPTLPVNWNGAPAGTTAITLAAGDWTLLRTIDDHAISVLGAGTNLLKGVDALDPTKVIFEIEILDQFTGAYEVRLLQPLLHPDSDNDGGANNATDDGKGVYEDNLNIPVDVTYTSTPGGSTTAALNISVDDDSPDATLAVITVDKDGDGKLVHDETAGVDHADDVLVRPAALTAAETGLGLGDGIGYAHTTVSVDLSNGNALTPNAAYGADGPGEALLALTKSDGSDFDGEQSNLQDTTTGDFIFLYTEEFGGEKVVVGRVGTPGANDAGEVSFILSLGDNGSFDLGQYRAIKHPVQGDNTLGEHDDAVTLLGWGGTSSLVHITLTLVDEDGDATSKTIPLSNIQQVNNGIVFEDDGPTARPDTDDVTEDGPAADGNVITGASTTSGAAGVDTLGTDTALVSKVSGFGGDDDSFTAGKLEVNGQYGSLTLDALGNYVYTLDNSNPTVNALNDGETLTETFIYTLTDGDGDTSPTTLKFTIKGATDDQAPIAYDDKVCGDEPAPRNVNVLLILDRSGSMGDVISTPDGDKTRLQLMQEATISMLTGLASNGDVKVMLVSFTTEATEGSAGQWVDVATAIAAINALTPTNLTNYEDALEEGAQAFNSDVADRGDFGSYDNLVFFMSDGVPTTGGDAGNGNQLTDANKQAWDNFLENPANSIDQLTVVGIGGAIAANDDDLEDVADPDYPGDSDSKDPFGTVLIVADENDLKDALSGTVATAKIEGNVLDGSIENDDSSPNGVVDGDGSAPTPGDADFLGDTPTHISQFKYDAAVDNGLDITINYDGVGNVEIGDITGGENIGISGTKVSFDADYGRMTFDFSTGQFTYLAGPISGGDKEEHFNYTLKDTDGDSDSANLTVCIQDKYVDLTPEAFDNHDALTESTVSGAKITVDNFNSGPTGTATGAVFEDSDTLELNTRESDGAVAFSTVRTNLIASGLNATVLDNLVGPNPVEGSSYVKQFNVGSPSILTFTYDYDGNDDDIDIATYFVIKTDGTLVSQGVLGVGDPDTSGTISVPLAAAGDYRVMVLITDRGDDSSTSVLHIDTIETQPATINTVSGNVVTDANDSPPLVSTDPNGAIDDQGDGPAKVTAVNFGATTVNVPSDGSNVTISGANGVLVINNTGAYTYTSLPGTVPNGAVETDAFTYVLKDADGDVDTAVLRLDVTGTNDPTPPNTNAGSGTGAEDAASITVSISGTDADGTVTSFKVTSLPLGGKLYADAGLSNEITLNETVSAIANAANLFFVPTANFNGVATFQYAAIDNNGLEDASPATATITVTSVNDLPNAVDDILITRDVNTDDSDNYTIQSAWLLRNDTSGDAAAFVSQVDRTGLDDPATVINGATSNFIIDPNGSDNFTYKASDGSDTDQAIVDVQNDGSGSFDGDADNEIIVGTAASETLNGNDGNDILAGGGGNDTLNGGKGDDWLVYDPADGTINGGDDFDTLRFESAQDIDIDAAAIIGRVTNIEAIDLRNGSATDDLGNTGGDNAISAADVIAMADGDDTIYIMGEGDGGEGGAPDDEVRLDGTWVAGATTAVNDPAHPEINGLTFTQYTSGTATLFIQTTIDVDN